RARSPRMFSTSIVSVGSHDPPGPVGPGSPAVLALDRSAPMGAACRSTTFAARCGFGAGFGALLVDFFDLVVEVLIQGEIPGRGAIDGPSLPGVPLSPG